MGRNTDHAGFLLAIAADPVDRLARDAYLDWLTERDDPRAEFIRVQEELARLEDTENEFHHKGCVCIACRPVRSRSAELLTTHERDWRGAMACGTCKSGKVKVRGQYDPQGADEYPNIYHEACPDCRGTGQACWPLYQYNLDFDPNGDTGTFRIAVTFRRGFVHTVRAPLDVLLAPGVAEAIGRYHPVERVDVTDDAIYTTQSGNYLIRVPLAITMRDAGVTTTEENWRLINTIYDSPEKVHDDISAALLSRFRRASAPQ